MITEQENNSILKACKELQPAKGMYLINNYVENLLLTVLDFQMHNVSVEKAINYYRNNRQYEIRTVDDLRILLSRYRDDKEGNVTVAQYLWGNNYWNRISLLRKLVNYFDLRNVKSQEDLIQWAKKSRFDSDFKGKIPGMGYAIYQWIIMRQGIETVKPDVHVRNFIESIIQRSDITDNEIVVSLENIAKQLGLKTYELDWRIWEYQISLKQNKSPNAR